jgi:hypothetical protein
MSQPTYIADPQHTGVYPFWAITNTYTHLPIAVCVEQSHADLIVAALNTFDRQVNDFAPTLPEPQSQRNTRLTFDFDGDPWAGV